MNFKKVLKYFATVSIIVGVFGILYFGTDSHRREFKIKNWNQINISNIDINDNDNFCFAMMGDNRDGNDVFVKLYEKIDRDPDIIFAINNGDVVSDGKAKEYEDLIEIIRNFKKPLIMTVGNHDIKNHGKLFFEKIFGPTYFNYEVGNVAFIFPDISLKSGITFDSKQDRWLKKVLKESKDKKFRLVSFHIPLFDPNKFPFDPFDKPELITEEAVNKSYGLKNNKLAFYLANQFEEYNINYIFTSHNHAYYDGFWNKIPFIVSGGAGAPLRQNRDKEHAYYHYVKVCIDGDSLTTKVERLN